MGGQDLRRAALMDSGFAGLGQEGAQTHVGHPAVAQLGGDFIGGDADDGDVFPPSSRSMREEL